ncbi:MAG: DUF1343 domain-containing protein [Candidatus Sericytochromatia bacterium]|nr:DUF1343 domain-containing protein [Candidatus Sericytochromatia bacterium]
MRAAWAFFPNLAWKSLGRAASCVLLCAAGASTVAALPIPAGRVQTGAERVLSGEWRTGRIRKVALLTHAAAVSDTGERDVLALVRRGPWHVERLFTPEHGLDAALQGQIRDGAVTLATAEGTRSLGVRSLYGTRLKPRAEDLAGLDAVVVDLQDVGARFYTYGATLRRVMEVCRERGVKVVVLDRPNPLGGEVVEGGILDPRFLSFTGPAEVAVRHGLTLGELARWFNDEIGGQLEVVPVAGLTRRDLWSDLGRPWTPPSPAMTSFESALCYPGACFFEATRLDVRVGDRPFTVWGAPWLDAAGLVSSLQSLALPGVEIRLATLPPGTMRTKDLWEPVSGPRGLERVPSVEPFQAVVLDVRDPRAFRPVTLAVHALAWLQAHHAGPLGLESRGFDRMAGTDILRLGLLEGRSPTDLLGIWSTEPPDHLQRWRRARLYR